MAWSTVVLCLLRVSLRAHLPLVRRQATTPSSWCLSLQEPI
uniref:Uncharacterized protein n=1 Tax=Anguilla anguilla TaxID=7936 RepID=A0A0E9UAZ9_ANGAN